MDALVLAAAVVALAAWIAAPLYRAPAVAEPDRAELRARYDALVASLRELEIDRSSGLVAALEHAERRAALERQAAAVLHRLEDAEPDPSPPTGV